MKTTRTQNLMAAALVGVLAFCAGCATDGSLSQAEKYKMTTAIPPAIASLSVSAVFDGDGFAHTDGNRVGGFPGRS